MAHISVGKRKVDARFIKNKENKILIEFADPAYARAESILFDPKSQSLHAILHEGMFLIGHAPEEIIKDLMEKKSVELCADHYAGKVLRMHASVSILKH